MGQGLRVLRVSGVRWDDPETGTGGGWEGPRLTEREGRAGAGGRRGQQGRVPPAAGRGTPFPPMIAAGEPASGLTCGQLGCGAQVLDADTEAGGGGLARAPEPRSASPGALPLSPPGSSQAPRRLPQLPSGCHGVRGGRGRFTRGGPEIRTSWPLPPHSLPSTSQPPRVQASQGPKGVKGAGGPGNGSQDPGLATQIY